MRIIGVNQYTARQQKSTTKLPGVAIVIQAINRKWKLNKESQAGERAKRKLNESDSEAGVREKSKMKV
jgi:hypothetical protein